MIELTDFPKIECPFVRKQFHINVDDWKQYGNRLQIREPHLYLVTPEINPTFEWVFDDPDTFAVEKLDGTNVKIATVEGELKALCNRKQIINPLQIVKGKTFIIEGIFTAIQKGYVHLNGEQAGEVIGPKLQGNPYELNNHIWYPFDKAIKHLRYKSFHDHARTFDNWSSWFKDWLYSRFATKSGNPNIMAEGVVFYNLKRKAENKRWRAKLRRNMFDWYYSDYIRIGDIIQED